MKKDSREHVRIDEHLTVSYHLLKMPHGVSSRTANISRDGMRLPVLHRFSVGTLLELELTAPELQKSVKVVGEVMWSNRRNDIRFPFEVGIRFRKIDPSDCKLLHNHIHSMYEEKKRPDVGWIEKE
jgi:Tfp pilus assembly protein PilZ